MTKRILIFAGSLAQKPGQGGHSWVVLQYLLGFRKLGWDVTFVDRLEPEMCVDDSGAPATVQESANLSYFSHLMASFGLEDSYCLLCDGGRSSLGLSRAQLRERVKKSTLLLNTMGFLEDPDLLSLASRRVFLDIDPGFGQMWRALGLADVFADHDAYVTIGENIGKPECTIPDCGLAWITTKQPVVLEQWPAQNGGGKGPLTSVASWRGAYGPIDYGGTTYGLRVHEFRRFADLPRRSGRPFEMALNIHPEETRDIELLQRNGWSLVEPRRVAGDPFSYRSYIQGSRAEFSVAKSMYVQSRSGWFSDRSICYLASGRPVLTQDTGLEGLCPTDVGILTFANTEEALDRLDELEKDYDRHARAARSIAEECFDSSKVLTRLVGELGID